MLVIYMLIESLETFHSPLNISGAPQQNSIVAFFYVAEAERVLF